MDQAESAKQSPSRYDPPLDVGIALAVDHPTCRWDCSLTGMKGGGDLEKYVGVSAIKPFINTKMLLGTVGRSRGFAIQRRFHAMPFRVCKLA